MTHKNRQERSHLSQAFRWACGICTGCFASFVLLLLVLFLGPCGHPLGGEDREAQLHELIEHSRPLVGAIKAYEADHSEPPADLDALIPDYLPAVPNTGWFGAPDYDYDVLPQRGVPSRGSRWRLRVHTTLGFLNWDMLEYKPEQDYLGSPRTPVGDWSYFHE